MKILSLFAHIVVSKWNLWKFTSIVVITVMEVLPLGRSGCACTLRNGRHWLLSAVKSNFFYLCSDKISPSVNSWGLRMSMVHYTLFSLYRFVTWVSATCSPWYLRAR